MPDTTIINVITPTPTPIDIEVDAPAQPETDIEVVQIEEKVEGSFNYTIDNGSRVIEEGLKTFVEWGFPAVITGWTILADVVGDIVVDVWKDTYGNFAPTVADSIAGTEKPTLSAARKNQDLSLTSFQTTVARGDIWAFNVDSITDIKNVTIAFRFNRT